MARESRQEQHETTVPQSSGFRVKGMVEGKSQAREECVTALKAVGPISDTLIELMEIPQDMHRRATDDGSSFSSDAAKGIETVPDRLFLKLGLPNDLPDYGIMIHSRGSSIFCTLLDQKRKIIVSEAVGNLNSSGGGNWSAFQSSLESAVSRSKALQSEGKEFRFVVESEGGSVID